MRSFELHCNETVRYSDGDGVLEIRRERTARLVCDHDRAPRKALQSGSPRRRRRKVTVTVVRPNPAPAGLLPDPNRQSL